jgi:hypothetical protein
MESTCSDRPVRMNVTPTPGKPWQNRWRIPGGLENVVEIVMAEPSRREPSWMFAHLDGVAALLEGLAGDGRRRTEALPRRQ